MGKDIVVTILETNPIESILNIGTVETTICNGKIYEKKIILMSCDVLKFEGLF